MQMTSLYISEISYSVTGFKMTKNVSKISQGLSELKGVECRHFQKRFVLRTLQLVESQTDCSQIL